MELIYIYFNEAEFDSEKKYFEIWKRKRNAKGYFFYREKIFYYQHEIFC